jgi:protein-S-isoprenylcysteine O-methyltransferase Ste14
MALLEIQWHPDGRQLRGFGLICVVVFVALGAWVRLTHTVFWLDIGPDTARRVTTGFWIAAAACGALGAVAPTMLRPLYLLLTVIGLPVGFVIAHVVMAIVFFGLFTPIGLVFRLIGRDALDRRIDRNASTYWVPRRAASARQYFRQF